MCLQFHSYISRVQSLWGELFISAGGDTRGESRWARPFKGAGGLGEDQLSEWCLFQKMPEPLQPGGRAQVWAPAGRARPHHGCLLLSSLVGAEAEAIHRWLPSLAGSFLQPRFGSNHKAPWASAGLSLADSVPCFCALVRRMRETDGQHSRDWDWDPRLRTRRWGGQSARS